MTRIIRHIGLGLLVGAVLYGEAGAQQRDTARTRRDTLRGARDTLPITRDTMPRRDSTDAVRVPIPAGADSLLLRDSLPRRDLPGGRAQARDTIKAPIATAEAPLLVADPAGSFIWDRRDLFSTGALTVQDLLDRVPGITGLRAGWIAEPMVSSFLGDPRRVRVFLDGLELEEMDPRMRGVWDLTQIPLWALDDIRIERVASEVRLHLRSWRVDRTTPFTRTDIYTGDQGTNLYRGLFGRRYQHGEVIQAAGQQFGTNPGRFTESSDQLGALVRVGWASGRWSTDAFVLRSDRNRGRTFSEGTRDTVPATESSRADAYARVAWGSPDSGPWVQGLASATRYAFGGKGTSSTGTPISVDTSRSRSQYVLAGGYARGPLRASVTQRYRVGANARIATPAARLSFDTRLLGVSLSAEGRGLDSTRRADVSAILRPTSFLYLSGSAGTERPLEVVDSVPLPNFLRAEAGVRLRHLWISGGLLRRDPVLLDAPTIFRGGTRALVDTATTAYFASVRGRVWKALYMDVQGVQWSDTGSFYRPKYQTRSELYVSTSLLRRFPSGNFHLLASGIHEYRSSSLWPHVGGTSRVPGYRVLSSLLQVRILRAELFWNFRNVLGEQYAQVPGYRLPRLTNIYGVRWEFWN